MFRFDNEPIIPSVCQELGKVWTAQPHEATDGRLAGADFFSDPVRSHLDNSPFFYVVEAVAGGGAEPERFS